jgi:flagellar protein FliL
VANKTTDDEVTEDAGKKKKGKKKLVIVVLLVGGLVYQFVLKKSPPPEDAAAAEVVEEGEVAVIEELVVNLADRDSTHYLRVGIGVVLEAGIAVADIEPELAKINDIVIDVVSTKTYADLREPGSTSELKDEISLAARAAFDDERVVRLIFTSFVMQ